LAPTEVVLEACAGLHHWGECWAVWATEGG
jgi:hypothetical protein